MPSFHPRLNAAPLRHVPAFTLIELLVVIAIISVLMAVAFPAITMMSRLTRGGAAETTIGIAARTAAAYAGKPKRTLSNPDPAGIPAEFSSNGAAVLFTPNGDIRILQTALLAFDNAGDPLQPTRFGYEDIPNRDYINLPDNTGVVGILRVSGTIKLITPPFAIHFDKFGQATTGYAPGDDVHMVFYDSDYDGKFDITDERSSSYNPNEWNNKSDEWNGHMDDANLRPRLPFERIETVVGVLMYQIPDFNSGDDTAANNGLPRTLTATSKYLDDPTKNWLLETDANGQLVNAKAIFFSRNSGSILQEYR